MQGIQVLQPGSLKKRVSRTPNFGINGTVKPFGLYPVMIHPVLPGETLKSMNWKWRMLSKPVKHPLTGVWLETWVFYVKLTDLDRTLSEMFISDSVSTSGHTAGSDNARLFQKSGQIDWVGKCLNKVAASYFVNENESIVASQETGIPKTKINATGWWQNMMFRPADDAVVTGDIHDLKEQMSAAQMLQQMQMTEISYERYLQQYGVQSIKTAEGDPEILRFSRSWTMPTNTVEPSTGAPSSAWAWSDEMKLEKDKYFTEPGFLFAVATVRPKMYPGNLSSSLVGNLWGFSDWYPIYNLRDDPSAGVKEIQNDDDIFVTGEATTPGPLWYDHKDLLSHGETFVNNWSDAPYDIPDSGMPLVANGTSDALLRGEYPVDANINALFSSATAADQVCYYDGIIQATIAGQITDTTRLGHGG